MLAAGISCRGLSLKPTREFCSLCKSDACSSEVFEETENVSCQDAPPISVIGYYSPDISRVECTHIQGIRAADVVVYLKVLITQKMGALGSPEG